MRAKPPADVAISLSDTLTQIKSFNEEEESRRNSMMQKNEAGGL